MTRFEKMLQTLPTCMVGGGCDDAKTAAEMIHLCRIELDLIEEGQDGTEEDYQLAIRKWLKKWTKPMTKKEAFLEANARWSKIAGCTPMLQKNPEALNETDKQPLRAKLSSMPKPEARTREQKKEVSKLRGVLNTFRCSVGYTTSVGLYLYHVKGEGDTWEEAFDKADQK